MDLLYKTKRKHEIDRSLSYSRIKDFAENGPDALINRSKAQSVALSIGSLTDDFLDENVNVRDKYIVYDGSKPTATLGKLCNFIIDNYNKVPTKKEVLKIIEQNNYWSGIKNIDVLTSKFDIKDFWEYIDVIITNRNSKKEIITTDMYLIAEDLALLIKTHNHTKDLFSEDYQRIYQYFFKIKIKNVVFKGAIDYIAIDHKNKTVQIVDFKTGKEPGNEFTKAFMQYKYYLQEAVYMKAFRSICAKYKLKGYNLLPFMFVYISKTEMVPVKYTISKKWHNAAINGFTTISGYKYKGLMSLIDDIIWHYNNRVFNMSRELYESNGFMKVEDNFININNIEEGN